MKLGARQCRRHALRLVDDEEGPAPGPAELVRYGAVLRGQARAGVDYEQHGVGFVHGLARLPRHFPVDALSRLRLETAGINDEVRLAAHSTVAVVAIASDTGNVSYDSIATARQPVEQGRLADVW